MTTNTGPGRAALLVILALLGLVTSCADAAPPSTNAGAVAVATPTPAETSTPAPTPTATPTPTPAPTAVPTTAPPAPAPVAQPAPPATAARNDPYADATAAGASAVCADGSWSFSQTRSGTCSHHGGVHWWTGNLGPAGPGGH